MSIEAMKLALAALSCIDSPLHLRELNKVGAAMSALRQAIEQAEQREDAYLFYAPGDVLICKESYERVVVKHGNTGPMQLANGKIALEWSDEVYGEYTLEQVMDGFIREGYAPRIKQAEQDHTYGYAKELAEAIFKQHFASDQHYASGRIVWGVNDTVIGILTQIDNMIAGMVRKPEQAQPVALPAGFLDHGGIAYWHNPTNTPPKDGTELYLAPPPRKPLTDEQLENYLGFGEHTTESTRVTLINLARAVERAHGIKGEE